MRGMYYCDYDFRTIDDDKIQEALSIHGAAALGVFMAVVAQIYLNDGSYSVKSLKVLSHKLYMTEDEVRHIIDTLVEVGLFMREDDILMSRRITEDLLAFIEQKKKKTAAANKRWNRRAEQDNDDADTDAMQEQCTCTATAMQEQSERNADEEQVQNDCNAVALLKENKTKQEKTINKTQQQQERYQQTYSRLIEVGISASVASSIMQLHNCEYIQDKFALLACQKNVESPAGWLIQAIDNDWQGSTISDEKSDNCRESAHKDNYYETFKSHYYQAFGKKYDAGYKAWFSAAEVLGTISAVLGLVDAIAKNGAAMKDIMQRHCVRSFGELLSCEPCMREVLSYSQDQESRERSSSSQYIAFVNRTGNGQSADQ